MRDEITSPSGAGQGTSASVELELTAQIVAAYLSHNLATIDDLPGIIQSVHGALSGMTTPVPTPVAEKLVPAVPVKRSVTPDFIICLEDGKRMKMLKRHLTRSYGLTPNEYRAKWGLPLDYPMVAPNYAAQRSVLAKQIGLGRLPSQSADEAAPAKRGPGRPKRSAA